VVVVYVSTLHRVNSHPPASMATPATATASESPVFAAPTGSTPIVTPDPNTSPRVGDESPPKPAVLPSSRGSRGATAGELADQIALVDAARGALASGGAQRALSLARDYQTQYPSGTFRPEVAAVKVEALVKLGRMAEARTLAERFAVAYGPGPLADRVARLARIAKP